MNKTKICKKCGEEKDINEFGKEKRNKDGYMGKCKECVKEYKKQYYQDNKEDILERNRQYYQDNKEDMLERNRQYYQDNKEYFQEKHKQYYEENKEQRLEYQRQYKEEHKEEIEKYKKQWYEENKEQRIEYQRQYREENKEYYKEYQRQYKEENKNELSKYHKQYYQENREYFQEKQRLYYEENKDELLEYARQYHEKNPHIRFNAQNKRRSREEEQGKGITKEQWYEMMIYFDFKCAYSGEYLGGNNENKNRTIDHILCLDSGGLNEIWNVVPMLKSYNSSKNKSNPMQWYKRQEYFDIDRLNKIIEWQIYSYNKWATEEDEDLILIVDIK